MTEESPRKKGIQAEMLVGVSAVFIGVRRRILGRNTRTGMHKRRRFVY